MTPQPKRMIPLSQRQKWALGIIKPGIRIELILKRVDPRTVSSLFYWHWAKCRNGDVTLTMEGRARLQNGQQVRRIA